MELSFAIEVCPSCQPTLSPRRFLPFKFVCWWVGRTSLSVAYRCRRLGMPLGSPIMNLNGRQTTDEPDPKEEGWVSTPLRQPRGLIAL